MDQDSIAPSTTNSEQKGSLCTKGLNGGSIGQEMTDGYRQMGKYKETILVGMLSCGLCTPTA